MEQSIRGVKALGGKIREIRKARRYTQEVVISKLQVLGCDISRSTYAKIEAGIRHISISELKAIAEVLDTDYNTLLSMESEGEN